jgi:hypothetical protein
LQFPGLWEPLSIESGSSLMHKESNA